MDNTFAEYYRNSTKALTDWVYGDGVSLPPEMMSMIRDKYMDAAIADMNDIHDREDYYYGVHLGPSRGYAYVGTFKKGRDAINFIQESMAHAYNEDEEPGGGVLVHIIKSRYNTEFQYSNSWYYYAMSRGLDPTPDEFITYRIRNGTITLIPWRLNAETQTLEPARETLV